MSRPPPPDEATMLMRARDGDMDAHADLYAAFAPAVYTLARRMLLHSSLAEDVLQETFVEVIRKIAGYRGEAGFGSWVKRIAINKCLMHLRSGWSSRRGTMPDVETLVGTGGGDALDQQMTLEAALAQLSDTARFVVWLHDVEGYTHTEIGRMMHRTASFSKSQLARAHDRLRVSLDGWAPADGRKAAHRRVHPARSTPSEGCASSAGRPESEDNAERRDTPLCARVR